LKAVSCQNGDGLAQEQLMAASKEKVLAALGEAATTLRGKLGESLVSVQKFDVPLEQATTSSLEALKAYTLGRKSQREKGSSAALPFFQRATELDPNFASAYLGIGIMYSNMAQTARAKEYMTKAFQLRDRESELEKLHIASVYHQIVTGDLEKAAETYEEWIANYPKTYGAYSNLANAYANEGRYQKAEELSRRAMQLEPNALPVYNNLGTNLLCLNRFAEARKTLEEALSRNLDDDALHQLLFGISFAEGDAQRMTKEAAWFDGKPEFEHEIFAAESDAEAYSGHLDRARGLTR